MAGGYTAVRSLRNVDGVRGGISGAGEWFQTFDRPALLAFSRHFYRNNGLYEGLVNRAAAYIIGTGFRLQARTQDVGWNAAAESLWNEWWRSPELKGRQTGRTLQISATRELLQTGEIFLLLTNRGLVQHLEAEQICGLAESDNGITLDKNGRAIKFSVRGWNESGQANPPVVVNGENVVWTAETHRPSCVRGVPPLQSSFPMLHRLNDVLDSEALSWQLLSKIALSQTVKGEVDPDTGDPAPYDYDANPLDQVYEGDWAMIFRGQPGDEIRAVDRNIPGKDFPQSVRMYLRLVGVPLGLPLEFILLDWTGGNYSQSRAVMEQAYQQFEQWQERISYILDAVYRWKIMEWQSAGLLARNEYWGAHEWFAPTWPWLDQLKEVQAATQSIEGGFSTHGEILKKLNKDRAEYLAETEREWISAIETARRIKEATGVEVDWKPLAGRVAGKTEQAVNAANKEPQEVGDGKPEEDGKDA